MYGEEDEAARERRARSHSARAAILTLLATSERALTATQIRAALPGGLNLPARNVYYHLRVLESHRLIVEHEGFYKLA